MAAIDRTTLLSLFCDDEDILKQVIIEFVNQYPVQLQEVETAIQRRDSAALAGSAHKLRGSIGNFTQESLFEETKQIEALAQHSDFERASQVCTGLRQGLKIMEDQLSHIL